MVLWRAGGLGLAEGCSSSGVVGGLGEGSGVRRVGAVFRFLCGYLHVFVPDDDVVVCDADVEDCYRLPNVVVLKTGVLF